jgi:hypothetical protein
MADSWRPWDPDVDWATLRSLVVIARFARWQRQPLRVIMKYAFEHPTDRSELDGIASALREAYEAGRAEQLEENSYV